MGSWPYEFLTLEDPADRVHRQQIINRYAVYAQLLMVAAITPALILRLVRWVSGSLASRHGAAYQSVPDSPVMKARRTTTAGTFRVTIRRIQWWLDDDVYFAGRHWGQRDQWVFGSVWGCLMLFLCFPETGRGESCTMGSMINQ